jgi:AcrR family transcriptional regulator
MTDRTTTRPARRGRRKLGRPPASDAAVSRQTLLEVAGRHFAHSGYGGAALKEIAADANMTSGAIYYYFDSKSDLYAAVGEHWVSDVLRRYKAGLTSDMGLADRLKLYLEVLIDEVVKEPDFARFWMHVDVEADQHDAVADLRAKTWKRSIALRSGVATGTLAAGADEHPVEALDAAEPPAGSEELPGVVLLEMLILGIGRVATQPGGLERLPLLLEPMKQLIDGQIGELELAQERAVRRLRRARNAKPAKRRSKPR